MSQSSISSPLRQGGIPESRLWHCPADFDAAKCLTPSLRRYGQEAAYFLGLLHWQQTFRFRRLSKAKRCHGVYLKAEYLRAVMGRQYAKIIQSMEASDAITVRRVYLPGRKCYCYNLGDLFSKQFKKCRLTKPRIIQALERHEKACDATLTDLHQAMKALLSRIQVDQEAFQEAETLKDPDQAKEVLRVIQNRTHRYTVDEYQRAHTAITSLPKVLRKFLTVDGKPLISLDISCSHPICLGMKLLGIDPHELNRRAVVSARARPTRSSNQRSNVVTHSNAVTPSNSRNRSNNRNGVSPSNSVTRGKVLSIPNTEVTHSHSLNDVQEYDPISMDKKRFLRDAETGNLYELFAEKANRTRDEMKVWLLRAINHDPKKWINRNMKVGCPILFDTIQAFENRIPLCGNGSSSEEERPLQAVARFAERRSLCVFNMICEAIHTLRPEMFIATIHDAILCKPEDAAFVRKIMEAHFKTLGVQPRIKEKSA